MFCNSDSDLKVYEKNITHVKSNKSSYIMAESMICEMSGPQHLRNVFAILEPMKRPRVPTEAQFDLQTLNINQIFAYFFIESVKDFEPFTL